MKPKLRTCPFCGSSARIEEEFNVKFIACGGQNCDAYGPSSQDLEEAVKLWNRRVK